MKKGSDTVKKILSIYRIDKDEFPETVDTTAKAIDHIILTYKDWRYSEEVLSKTESNWYAIRLFSCYQSVSYESWEGFFKGHLQKENFLNFNIDGWNLANKKGNYLSFVVFLEKGESLYAFCVWKWYLLVERWAEQYFWFEIIARLLNPKSKAIHQLTNNALTGSDFETSSIFRTGQSFISQDDFGKIIKEAIAELDKEALAKIWIEKNFKTNCIAKTHFTVKSNISLDDLTQKILPNIERLLTKTSRFLINQIEEVKKTHPDYEEIQKSLISKLFVSIWEFDFFPPKDAASYFTAHGYELLRKEVQIDEDAWHIKYIATEIRSRENGGDLSDFKSDLKTSVRAMGEDGLPIMDWFSLFRCLHGEFENEWKKYFWLNGKIWVIKSTAIERFNSRCWAALDNHFFSKDGTGKRDDPIPFKKFAHESEWKYNDDHDSPFVVIDAKLVDNIELCDLLYPKDDTLYVIHVKQWFNRDIRVLSSQLLTSARLILDHKSWDDEFLGKVATKMEALGKIWRDDFLGLFNTKKIVFVLAFTHPNDINSEEAVKRIGSNIAKLELFETTKSFKSFNPPFELRIVQLPS